MTIASSSTVFLVDTCSWIRMHEEAYPPDVLPSLWDNIVVLGGGGRVVTITQVVNECGDGNSGVSAWLKAQPIDVVKPGGRIAAIAGKLSQEYPAMIKARHVDVADPWVVAHASASNYTVVTEERPVGRSGKPQLREACAAYNVVTVNTLSFLRQIGFKR